MDTGISRMLGVCSRLPEATEIQPIDCNKRLQHIRLRIRCARFRSSGVMYSGSVMAPLAAYCETMRCGVAVLVILPQVAGGGGNTAAA
jgi:hypothetical protein